MAGTYNFLLAFPVALRKSRYLFRNWPQSYESLTYGGIDDVSSADY